MLPVVINGFGICYIYVCVFLSRDLSPTGEILGCWDLSHVAYLRIPVYKGQSHGFFEGTFRTAFSKISFYNKIPRNTKNEEDRYPPHFIISLKKLYDQLLSVLSKY